MISWHVRGVIDVRVWRRGVEQWGVLSGGHVVLQKSVHSRPDDEGCAFQLANLPGDHLS